MGRWMLMSKASCKIILVLIVRGRWILMKRGSCEINTGDYCDGEDGG
jgi:hypothetical protein